MSDGLIFPSIFVQLFTSQNWNDQIWIKIEQKLGLYFSQLLKSPISMDSSIVHWSVPLLLALGDDGGSDAVQLQDGLMQRLELLKSKQSVASDGEEVHQGRQPLPSPTGFPN